MPAEGVAQDGAGAVPNRRARGAPGPQYRGGVLGKTERLEIFSDGVVAIAITLLVLDLRLPTAKAGGLWHAIGSHWPSYFAYVLSFAVIGIIWVSHHTMFGHIGSADRGLLFWNLFLLLGVAFVPFPTSLLAQYVHQGGTNAEAAAAVYSMTMTVIGLGFLAIWLHLRRHPNLLDDQAERPNLDRSIRLSLVSPVVYGLTIGLAFISPVACLGAYALIAAYLAAGPSSRALVARPLQAVRAVAAGRPAGAASGDGDGADPRPAAVRHDETGRSGSTAKGTP